VVVPEQNASVSFAVGGLDKVRPLEAGESEKIFVQKLGRTETGQSFL
jgi:hypothetical protein